MSAHWARSKSIRLPLVVRLARQRLVAEAVEVSQICRGGHIADALARKAADVAISLRYQDGGKLVRRLYGHRDRRRALDRIVGAYAEQAGGSHPKARGSSTTVSPQESLF
jgi:hypothetical protein